MGSIRTSSRFAGNGRDHRRCACRSPRRYPPRRATLVISLDCPASVRIFADAAAPTGRRIAASAPSPWSSRATRWRACSTGRPPAPTGANISSIPTPPGSPTRSSPRATAPRRRPPTASARASNCCARSPRGSRTGAASPPIATSACRRSTASGSAPRARSSTRNGREKLTLGTIARQCGLNRTKLSRGFRELYRCSVGEALADKRLAEARRQLLATDLPVSVIGYRTGYSNNASFSRAFGRRFGQSPSELRSSGVAA